MPAKWVYACLMAVVFATPFPVVALQSTAAPAEQQVVPSSPDAKEIIRRAIEADDQAEKLARNYTYQQRTVEKRLDKHGSVKSQEIKTYDITIYNDEPYSRLIGKDDKALSDKDQEKEEEKLNKHLAKFKNESEDDRASG